MEIVKHDRQKEERMIQPLSGDRDMNRAVKILAKTLFRELTSNGYETRQIVALSTELIGLVTLSMNEKGEPPAESS